MIPVLIVPILNRPELLEQMVASVDVRVGTWVVVDNGDVVDPEARWGAMDWRHIRPGHNLGVGASWNLGMKATPEAPWWFITGFDMIFAPGDLGRLIEAMENAKGPHIGIVEGFSAFGINREALELVGYFDENLHPAYYEDNDYAWRCKLAYVPLVSVEASSKHVGSATIYGNPSYRDQNHKTFEKNKAYYIAKWGGQPGQERFEDPFGEEGAPAIQPRRIREQAWRRA